jgi:diguanylate cyclase (GGDEF)-like protein/PAS domain S-box-containing protein
VFEELQDYAVYHFEDEEAIWARYLPDDPLEAEHRAGHRHFFDTVARLRANASEHSAAVITEQVLEFLARWLASHILETDRHMAATVLGLQAGLDMAAAKQRADTEMAGSTRALIDIILSIYGALSTNTVRLMRETHEHQQSVAALKASEARMRSLFEKAPLPYQSLDMAGHVLEVNAAWQSQMGYTREEVLGRFVGDFIADESMGTLEREFPAFQARGRTDGPVFEMVRKDGSRFLWQVNGRIAQDESGQSSQTHCLLTDITEQQRVQQQLEHLGRHQQLLLDLSTTFINLPLAQVDVAIQSALGKMAHFVNADRAYLFSYDFERRIATNTHEWCGPGITPQLDARQQVPLDSIPDWVQTHRQGQPLLIADVEAVPPGALREWLLHQHIQSLAALPLMGEQHCLGFVGFDAVHQHHEFTPQELQLLHLFATLLAHLRDRQHMESELSRERSFLKTLVHTIPDLMWLKDTQGVYLSCNPRFEQMFHAPEAQIVGKTDFDFVDEATARSFRANDELAIGQGRPTVNEEWVNFSAEGLGKWIETTKTPMFSADGTLLGVLGLGRDITERKAAQDRLQLAASVFTHASEGIMITTPEGVLVEVNDAFTRITGYNREEALGQSTRLLNSGRQHPGFYETMWQTLKQQGHWSGEIWNRRKSGEVYAELLNINAVHDAQGLVLRYVGLFSDISKQKEHEQRLEHIAHYDALTGLPNRVLLADRLRLTMAQSLRRAQSVAIVFLDLDGFKAVNDTHGHEMGDKLLVALSNRMQKSLRDGDTLARLGGDEFVAVLTDLAQHDAAIPVLERLRNAAALPFVVEGTVLEVTASLGVTFYPQPTDMDAEQLMRQADQAMYQAKLSGKNRFHLFDTEHDLSIRGHNEIQLDIRQGLKTQAFKLLISPRSTCARVNCWGSRRCCAGNTRCRACCHPMPSFRPAKTRNCFLN